MSRKHVALACLVIFLAIVGWDIYLALDDTPSNTISGVAFNAPRWLEHLVLFGMGLLVGHFWPTGGIGDER